MTRPLAAVLLAAGLAAVAPAADKPAVDQAKLNVAKHCGGPGGRWFLDKDHHFAWCTGGWLTSPTFSPPSAAS